MNRPSAVSRRLLTTLLCCALLLPGVGLTEPLRFALLGKRADQIFFIQVAQGCAEAAAAEGDSCVLLGAPGPAHFRRQNAALEQAGNAGLDGIALSVTHSRWLAEHALKRWHGPPLITFDSDLLPEYRHLRRAYVGLDNLAFGRRLGQLAQRFRPQGGRLCILGSDPRDTNLGERLAGIRQQLRGTGDEGDSTPLSGENGWREPGRCPLYSADNRKTALLQLSTLLQAGEAEVIVSVGNWPIARADAFRRQIGPLLKALDRQERRPVIVITADEPDESQLALLDEGLVQAYAGLSVKELGRQSYHVLKRLAQGLPIPEQVLVDSRVYLPKPTQR